MHYLASIGLALTTLAPLTMAQAQAFENLDFEGATVVSNDPSFGFLSWDLAVPHWAHGGGNDSDAVYLGFHHVGLTPWYQLLDASAPGPSPLQGNHSLAFANGHADAQSEQSAWIESFISQSGQVAGNARSLRFEAQGQVEVQVNDVTLPLFQLSPNAYAADITAYAGQTVTLRFVNKSAALHEPVVIDAVSWSSVAVVPEPAGVALMLSGLFALVGCHGRFKTATARESLATP